MPNIKSKNFYRKIRIACLFFAKALSQGELFGEELKETKEWKYGIASKLMKAATEIKKLKAYNFRPATPGNLENKMTWIIFDGTIDTYWVESMNSCLDDSRDPLPCKCRTN